MTERSPACSAAIAEPTPSQSACPAAPRLTALVLATSCLLSGVVSQPTPAQETAPPAAQEADEAIGRAVSLLVLLWDVDPAAGRKTLGMMAAKWRNNELSATARASLQQQLSPLLQSAWSADPPHPAADASVLLAALWKDPQALRRARSILLDAGRERPLRLAAFESLAAAGDDGLPRLWRELLLSPSTAVDFRSDLLSAAAALDAEQTAPVLLGGLASWDDTSRARALDVLTQRAASARQLLDAVERDALPPGWLNANHLRQLAASGDADVRRRTLDRFGAVRTARSPEREKVVQEMAEFLRQASGDSRRGRLVFGKVCAQCHQLHGQGEQVGPDLTSNGRSSFAQLVSNVFDPSLVIGPAYQARTVITVDGRVLTGLLAEDTPQRVTLKQQGGKLAAIPRDDIEEISISQLSLMPEGLEKQLSPEEIADLFAFLLQAEGP